MIEWLSGVVRFKDARHVVVDVQGVGYGVAAPASTFERLPEIGQAVELFIYHYVREDQQTLYGFLTVEERDVFEIFLGTSGIGPKTGLGILSALSIGDFARAVLDGNLGVLVRVPGVGRKTAERLVVDLRDKMKDYVMDLEAAGKRIETGLPQVRDAIQALVELGAKPPVATAAVARAVQVLGEKATAEELIKEALRHR